MKLEESNDQNDVKTVQELNENEIFVDNPATQNQPQAGLGSLSDGDSQKIKSKPSKKLIILIVLLVLVGGATAYSLLSKDKTTTQGSTETVTSQESTTDALIYQTNTALKGYDTKNNSAVDLLTIPDGATVLSASEDGKEVIYVTYGDSVTAETEESDGPTTLSVYRATAEKTDIVLETKNVTYKYTANPVISSDNTQVAYYAFPESSKGDYLNSAYIYTAKLASGNNETELVKASNDAHGPLIPVMWAEDSEDIYMTNTACFACEAPPSSNIWKVSIADKTEEKIFSQPDGTNTGSASASPDRTKIAVSAKNYTLGAGAEELAAESFDAYVIDLSDNSSKKIYSEKPGDDTGEESFQSISGWSQDSTNILFNVFKTTDVPSGDLQFTKIFDRFDAVSVSDGRVSPIPVRVDALNTSGSFIATTYKEQLFFSARDYVEGTETFDSSFYSLPLEDGVAEVKAIEEGVPKVQIIGSGKITSEPKN